MYYRNQIYDYPIESEGWNEIKTSLENKVKHKSEFDQEILCFESLFCRFNKKISSLFRHGFLKKEDCNLFSETSTFKTNNRVLYTKRYRAEYNPSFIQISVAAVIEDQYGNRLLLKRGDGRMSFVKGHVDHLEGIESISEVEYLKKNMVREINEELKIPGINNIDVNLCGYMYSTKTFYGREHLYALYKVKIDADIMKKIKSNEPDKHDIVIISGKTLNDPKYHMDEWCEMILKIIKL